MLMTARKPATVGGILTEEFMLPLGLTQAALAEAMGVQRKHVTNCATTAATSQRQPHSSWRVCSATVRISG